MHGAIAAVTLIRPAGRALTLLLFALALHGCALPLSPPADSNRQPLPAATGTAEPEAPAPLTPTGPAASLSRQAESALQAGDPGRAEILIERALRIDPGQALYWHILGRARYDQGAYAEAVQFFLKAESRMAGSGDLARTNRQYLEAARSRAK